MNKLKTPWLYIFQTECGKYQKIGRTRKDPTVRMKEVQGGCPIRLTLALAHKTEKASEIEQQVLLKFNKFKTIGEWFSMPKSELEMAISFVFERAI